MNNDVTDFRRCLSDALRMQARLAVVDAFLRHEANKNVLVQNGSICSVSRDVAVWNHDLPRTAAEEPLSLNDSERFADSWVLHSAFRRDVIRVEATKSVAANDQRAHQRPLTIASAAVWYSACWTAPKSTSGHQCV